MSSALRVEEQKIETAPSAKRLQLDPDAFCRNFNRMPFLIRHHLSDHPLFRLPRLIELARRLPEHNIEYNAGNISVVQDPRLTPRTGLSIEETIRRIEECNSWMVMKYIEDDAEYAELLRECLSEIGELSEPMDRGMCRFEGFVFISSPRAVTPCHIDPEYNFLLQIRGKKFMTVFDPADRSVLSEETLERYLAGSHRNLALNEDQIKRGIQFELNPGDGLHVPVTAPHYVKVGDNVSISFSVTFRTPRSDRRTIVYTVNSYLRRKGFAPFPYGQSEVRDSIKYNTYRALRRARFIASRALGR
ncbi:MAG: cupin-like domain-containing protein [Acidobacteriota bacterium]